MSKDFYKGKFGVWRTVGNRKVFIEDGDDLETAMFKSGKFNKIRHSNYVKKYGKVKPIRLPENEYALVMHEINTNFRPQKDVITIVKQLETIYISLNSLTLTNIFSKVN